MSRGMRGDSPGVGAISPYHERSFFATEPIPAGGEIFVEYVIDQTLKWDHCMSLFVRSADLYFTL
jgi:hypothetical protein